MEAGVDQSLQGGNGFGRPFALSLQVQLGTRAGGKHHDFENVFGIAQLAG